MKIFFAFVVKEFRHVLRDRRSLVVLVSMPVVMLLLFGFALSNEVKNAKIAVLDDAKDDVSRALIQKLDASRYFDVTQTMQSINEADGLFRAGMVRAVVVFPRNLQHDLNHTQRGAVQIIADATDTNTGSTIAFYAANVVRDYQQTVLMGGQNLPYQIQVQTKMEFNPQLKGAFNFVPGVMVLILILLCAMLTAVAIVKEKELGTLELILVSPVRPLMLIVAKCLPFLVVGFVNVAIILTVAYTALELPMRGNLLLLVGECCLFVLLALSLGLFISTRTDSQQTALFISLVGLMLPSLVFSGFMFPIENMPRPMQIISNVVPTKYFFNILKMVMIKGLGFEYVWKETLILGGMVLGFIGLSVRSFKMRLA
ncbi:MAG: ABC transporter permease [Oscillatoriales cyanobacterium]|nr:MAG: ABC transporter permease [Oscillatoriales cyanobacterium]